MATTPTAPSAAAALADGYVLPAPPRGRAELVVEPERAPAAGIDALRAAGSRMQVLLECQQQFFGELQQALAEVDASVHEETRARIKRQVQQLGEILAWCEAVQQDLVRESAHAAAGHEPIDLDAAIREAAQRHADEAPVLVGAGTAGTWWGPRAAFAQLLDLALRVASCRAGGGSVQVEVLASEGARALRFLGLGEPRGTLPDGLVSRFRSAVEALQVEVLPDELGPGGTGLLLRLPEPVGQPG